MLVARFFHFLKVLAVVYFVKKKAHIAIFLGEAAVIRVSYVI
jgi:hypothetical protein